MFESMKRVSVPAILLSAVPLVLVFAGCDPVPVSPTDCLTGERVPDIVTRADPPASIRLVGVCETETRLRGFLSVALFVPTDSTLHPDRYNLSLDGLAIPGLHASALDVTKSAKFAPQAGEDAVQLGDYRIVEFSLRRTEESREAWSRVYGISRTKDSGEKVSVGLRREGDTPLPVLEVSSEMAAEVAFTSFGLGPSKGIFGLFAAAVIIVVTILLMGGLKAGTGTDLPFSLSKCLMLWWSVLVGSGYLWIWLQTGEFNGILNDQALILMGIQGGTLAGAAGLNNTNPVRTKSSGKRGASRFFLDILQDSTGKPAIHRVQNLFWHVVLGIILIVSVYDRLWFPEFDGTLLVVAGLGNGIYLSGKTGERRTGSPPAVC